MNYFFPFGIFVPYGHENELREINRIHLNCILPCYETYTKKFGKTLNIINIAQNGRIKVLIHLVYGFQINRTTWEVLNMEEDYKTLVGMINEFKINPLLLGWYINDEMFECFNEHLRNITLTIHELDPDHPTVSVKNRKNTQSFINFTDVYGEDCYRVGDTNRAIENLNCYDAHNNALNGLLKSKPM